MAAVLAISAGCGREGLRLTRPPADVSSTRSTDGPASAHDVQSGGADGAVDQLQDHRTDRASERILDTEPDRGVDRAGATDAPASADGVLTLVAGKLGGVGAHDGIGGASRLDRPAGLAHDDMGRLFVADSQNHTIRTVVVATGEVTTLAGSAGQPGADDGVGAAARFDWPSDVAYDGAGNLFVADSGNDTIRKVLVATGAVTTLAGAAGVDGSADGVGAEARFSGITAVACDGAGNVFVAERNNGTIRKVVISTRQVTTLAGSTDHLIHADGVGSAAGFVSPEGLACDRAGNLYVADRNTIRHVATATGAVTTLVGNAEAWNSSDGTGSAASFASLSDLAHDGVGNLYVADIPGSQDLRIRRIEIATGAVTTVANQDDAAGACPWVTTFSFGVPPPPDRLGIASDSAGNIFVTVAHNGTLCKLAVTSRTVSTLAGAPPASLSVDGVGGEARFQHPTGLASDDAGNLFVIETCAIRKVRIATSEVTTAMTGSCGRYSAGIFASVAISDRKGNLFFPESGTIRRMVIDTEAVATLAGTWGKYGHQDGTGAEASFGASVASLSYDGAGTLWVVESDAPAIRKVDIATGIVTTLALSASSALGDGSALSLLGKPVGSACDGAGSLFVADSDHCVIWKIALSTGEMVIVAGSPSQCGFSDGTGATARFLAPSSIASDGAGNLYVSDGPNHVVRKLDLATATVTTVVGAPQPADVVLLGPLPAHLNHPSGLAFVPGTGLFIADRNENAVLLARW